MKKRLFPILFITLCVTLHSNEKLEELQTLFNSDTFIFKEEKVIRKKNEPLSKASHEICQNYLQSEFRLLYNSPFDKTNEYHLRYYSQWGAYTPELSAYLCTSHMTIEDRTVEILTYHHRDHSLYRIYRLEFDKSGRISRFTEHHAAEDELIYEIFYYWDEENLELYEEIYRLGDKISQRRRKWNDEGYLLLQQVTFLPRVLHLSTLCFLDTDSWVEELIVMYDRKEYLREVQFYISGKESTGFLPYRYGRTLGGINPCLIYKDNDIFKAVHDPEYGEKTTFIF
ncbi:MAG: hypothetical protein PQJ59_18915 [Spirochaetales bacterium]|nr:hypothetical protein [Spirochaetales bacterium]